MFTLTKYFLNFELRNWRTASVQSLDESITYIIWLILCWWLVYKQNWHFIYYFVELGKVVWMSRHLWIQFNWIHLAVYNLNLGLLICCGPSKSSQLKYYIYWFIEYYQIWIQVKWKINISICHILKFQWRQYVW